MPDTTWIASRYLVTGCAGFIAARVAQLLLADGHEVVGIDDLNDAYDPRLKLWRLEELKSNPRFHFHLADIASAEAMESVLDRLLQSGPAMAAVVNLAARAGVQASVSNPRAYLRTNCEGTLNLLEACRRHGVKKFVLASSSSLYGAEHPLPYREDLDTSRPLTPYAASKKAAETLAYVYHYLHGADVSILRYFTVYGPAGRPDMSIFRFIRWIAEGEPVQLFGDGRQQRDFTYVDDIARGTVAALKPLGFEIINLGGGQPTALGAVAGQLAGLLGKEPHFHRHAARRADAPAIWADIGKARSLLGWTPQVSLGEGLRRCVDWYLAHRDLALSLDLGEPARPPAG
jgi:nucleoside-diphosphate-sugar epimerase